MVLPPVVLPPDVLLADWPRVQLSDDEAGRFLTGLRRRIGLADGWRMVGHDRAVQGNLEPAVLLSDRETVRRRTLDVLAEAAGRPGHIFNLGHGVLPQTPVENVLELIATVKGG